MSTTTWVLLRGLTRDARHWGAFVEQLQASEPQARIITPDLPGNGARYRETSRTTIAAMSEDLRAQLAAQQLAPPYRVLALSLGAMLAIDWLHRYPQEIERAVLINTSLRGYSGLTRRLRVKAWPQLLRVATQRDPRAAETAILQLTSARATARGAAALDTQVLDDWTRWRAAQPVSARNALRQLAAAARFAAPSFAGSGLEERLLLLAGSGDRLVAPGCSRALARAWHCELRVHPWAGHDLPLDDPRWLVAQLGENSG